MKLASYVFLFLTLFSFRQTANAFDNGSIYDDKIVSHFLDLQRESALELSSLTHAQKVRQSLNAAGFQHGVYPSSQKSTPVENGFEPHLTGTVPSANRKDLVLINGAIDHVFTSGGVSSGPYQMKLEPATNLSVLSPELDRPASIERGQPTLSGILLSDALQILLEGKTLSLPLLVSGNDVYRAQDVCFADAQGKCGERMNRALENRIELVRAAIPLFPLLKIEKEILQTRLNEGKTVRIDFTLLPTAKLNLGSANDYLHPGENVDLQQLGDRLLVQYKKTFPNGSIADFGRRIRLLDCNLMAMIHSLERPGVKVAIGNLPSHPQRLDLLTTNHAWNFKIGEGTDRILEMADVTPTPSSHWENFFNHQTLAYAERKFAILTKDNFYLETLFDRIPTPRFFLPPSSAELEIKTSLAPILDLSSFVLEYPPSDSATRIPYDEETLRKLKTYALSVPGISSQYWIDRTGKKSFFTQLKTERQFGPSGMLVGRVTDSRVGDTQGFRLALSDSAVDAQKKLAQGGDADLWVLNPTKSLDFRTSKKTSVYTRIETAPSRARRGYLWPSIPDEKLIELFPEFVQKFPILRSMAVVEKPENPQKLYISGPSSMKSMADNLGMGFGVVLIRNHDRSFSSRYVAPVLGRIPTKELVDFWRSKNYNVIPTVRLNVDIVEFYSNEN